MLCLSVIPPEGFSPLMTNRSVNDQKTRLSALTQRLLYHLGQSDSGTNVLHLGKISFLPSLRVLCSEAVRTRRLDPWCISGAWQIYGRDEASY